VLRRFHRDQDGKVNAVHFILAAVLIVAGYVAVMYIPPWLQFVKIRRIATEVAMTGTTVETNDGRNKAWYDSRLKEEGIGYPMSEDLNYMRHDMDHLYVSFEYDYPIKHFWGKTHVLHYMFECDAKNGHCQ